MANKITTSGISDPSVQQPWLGPSLEFLQNATKEMIVGVCRSIMGEALYTSSATRGIAMAGCTFFSAGNNMALGYIFFNDELYYTGGVTGLNSYSDDPVVVLSDLSDTTIDPIQMSDNSTQSVHRKRRLAIVDQTLGTGLFDLRDMIYLASKAKNQISLSTYNSTGTGIEAVTGATFTVPSTSASLAGIKRKYRVKIIGNMYYPIGGAASGHGGYLLIRNSTASTTLAQNVASTEGNAAISGLHVVAPISVETITPALDPGTVIIGAIQDTDGNSRSFLSGEMFYEEVN